jgi:hypothetical protein
MIPRLFHYVWVGGAPLPSRLENNISTWLDFNRDYEVIRWDESNIDFSSPVLRRVYRLGYWARVADIARLQILHKYGGIYLDVDIQVIKPFDPLLSHKCFVGLENDSYVGNAVIGAEPENGFIEAALDAIRHDKVGVEKMDPSYGPVVLTDILLQKRRTVATNGVAKFPGDDVFVAPKQYFHPLDWDLPQSERNNLKNYLTPETICIHLFDHSWKAEKRWNLTFFLQTIIRLYPRVFRNRVVGCLYSQLVFCSEMARGRAAFILRKMPWQRGYRSWQPARKRA